MSDCIFLYLSRIALFCVPIDEFISEVVGRSMILARKYSRILCDEQLVKTPHLFVEKKSQYDLWQTNENDVCLHPFYNWLITYKFQCDYS